MDLLNKDVLDTKYYLIEFVDKKEVHIIPKEFILRAITDDKFEIKWPNFDYSSEKELNKKLSDSKLVEWLQETFEVECLAKENRFEKLLHLEKNYKLCGSIELNKSNRKNNAKKPMNSDDYDYDMDIDEAKKTKKNEIKANNGRRTTKKLEAIENLKSTLRVNNSDKVERKEEDCTGVNETDIASDCRKCVSFQKEIKLREIQAEKDKDINQVYKRQVELLHKTLNSKDELIEELKDQINECTDENKSMRKTIKKYEESMEKEAKGKRKRSHDVYQKKENFVFNDSLTDPLKYDFGYGQEAPKITIDKIAKGVSPTNMISQCLEVLIPKEELKLYSLTGTIPGQLLKDKMDIKEKKPLDNNILLALLLFIRTMFPGYKMEDLRKCVKQKLSNSARTFKKRKIKRTASSDSSEDSSDQDETPTDKHNIAKNKLNNGNTQSNISSKASTSKDLSKKNEKLKNVTSNNTKEKPKKSIPDKQQSSSSDEPSRDKYPKPSKKKKNQKHISSESD